MKLCFLGTAHPPYGYKKNDLLSASLLINGRLLIQPTEDIFRFTERYALPELTEGIRAVLVTCSHPRAFSPAVIERLAKETPIKLFSSDAVYSMCAHIPRVTHIPLLPFRTVTDGDIHLTPLPTGYTTAVCAEECFTAHIAAGERSLYVGLPNGRPSEDTQHFLRNHPVDAAILDVSGDERSDTDLSRHLTFSEAGRVREMLRESGAMRGRAYTMLSELPAFASPDEKYAFAEKARADGFLVPYDGYFIDL